MRSQENTCQLPSLTLQKYANLLTAADESGQYDDWIELYNTTTDPINLSGLYLSDKKAVFNKWALPDTVIGPYDYLIVWADEDGGQGLMHANFKLSAGGEYLSVSYADGTIMDSISYGEQPTDQSFGRLPNGTGPFVALIPSFSSVNSTVDVSEELHQEDIRVYPNTTKGLVYINLKDHASAKINLYDNSGKLMSAGVVKGKFRSVDLSELPSGNYTLNFIIGHKQMSKTIVKE